MKELTPRELQKLSNIDQQIIFWNMAKAALQQAPPEMQSSDEFKSVLNNIERMKREAKRRAHIITRKYDKSCP